jgi:hypothetical protein
MSVQNSYTERRPEALIGQLAENGSDRSGKAFLARGQVKAGHGVFRAAVTGKTGVYPTQIGEAYHQPSPAAAADVDAFLTATATDDVALDITTFNGASAGATLYPPRKLTVTLNTDTDWDASECTITYVNDKGVTVEETLTVPNGGNATLTTTGYASQAPTRFQLDAQTADGGSFTIGTAALAALDINAFVGVAMREVIKETLSSSDLYRRAGSAVTDTADFVDGESFTALNRGAIWVQCEEAVQDMDPVYVRISASGAEVLGTFRNDADGGDCVQVTGARFMRSTTGAGPAWVRFGLGY